MKRKELVKRYSLFIISLWFSALGVAITKCGSLGVSCISSVPNVLSLRFTALTIGGWTFVWNTLLVICQILLLRKNFQKIQLLQIPLSFLFGWFTDVAMLLAVRIPVNSYPMQLFMVVLGVVILAFGITLGVIANVVLNAGEGIVKALADVSGKEFGFVKVRFDVVCVILSLVISLATFGGKIIGVREGTLIAAFLNGTMVKWYSRRLKEPLDRVLRA
ncbi:MAG: YitT family protein [Clostridia bacterium]|nr:YitT family protein [Clostridia bacterium]